MNTKLIKRVKELFKSIYSLPYATLSLIKKRFSWFKNTSEGWETLLDELIEISTENDVEVVEKAYNVTITSSHPFIVVYAFSPVTKRTEWIGKLCKDWSGGYTLYFSRVAGVGKSVSSFESGVRLLLEKKEQEIAARLSIFAS